MQKPDCFISGVKSKLTVEMMRMFIPGRTDVFPVDDYALRKHMAAVLEMKAVPTPNEAKRLCEAWIPYRTIASLYLWNLGNQNVISG